MALKHCGKEVKRLSAYGMAGVFFFVWRGRGKEHKTAEEAIIWEKKIKLNS